MNILWLSSPFRKDDIKTNQDAIWVYTDNELREGGGEIREFMRSNENCHPLISRETIGKDGYFREDNIVKTTRCIKNQFDSLYLRLKQGKLVIIPSTDINEAILELEKHAPTLAIIFNKCFETINRFRMTTII